MQTFTFSWSSHRSDASSDLWSYRKRRKENKEEEKEGKKRGCNLTWEEDEKKEEHSFSNRQQKNIFRSPLTTGEGQSISAHPEKFAKRLCHDFQLELEKVFWVEDLLTTLDPYEVVSFIPVLKIGVTTFYRTAKRKASAHEADIIRKALTSLEPAS